MILMNIEHILDINECDIICVRILMFLGFKLIIKREYSQKHIDMQGKIHSRSNEYSKWYIEIDCENILEEKSDDCSQKWNAIKTFKMSHGNKK